MRWECGTGASPGGCTRSATVSPYYNHRTSTSDASQHTLTNLLLSPWPPHHAGWQATSLSCCDAVLWCQYALQGCCHGHIMFSRELHRLPPGLGSSGLCKQLEFLSQSTLPMLLESFRWGRLRVLFGHTLCSQRFHRSSGCLFDGAGFSTPDRRVCYAFRDDFGRWPLADCLLRRHQLGKSPRDSRTVCQQSFYDLCSHTAGQVCWCEKNTAHQFQAVNRKRKD